jgi:hypothetical protein
MKSSKKKHHHHQSPKSAILRSAYSGFCWIPPVVRRLFEVNSEPHTGARPSVRLCVGLITDVPKVICFLEIQSILRRLNHLFTPSRFPSDFGTGGTARVWRSPRPSPLSVYAALATCGFRGRRKLRTRAASKPPPAPASPAARRLCTTPPTNVTRPKDKPRYTPSQFDGRQREQVVFKRTE